ncbi:MAG: Lrp/AsnC family transcriptional regulator [Thermoplasmata archaeon]
MDEKDRRIITYLMEHGRDKISEMSKNLDIPRITIYERMQTMIKNGVIDKFTVKPNYKELGLPIIAFIFVAFDPKEKITQRELGLKISSYKEVEEVYIIAGEWDLLLKVRLSTIEEVGNFVLDKLREMKGIGKTETITVFSTVKQ